MSRSEYCHEEARLQSFHTSKVVRKKKYTWRFKLIPPEYLAKLGFYFDPRPNRADSIGCVYCHRNTSGIRESRAKSRDTLETMCNVLMLHLDNQDTSCLLSYLKLKLMRDAMYNVGVSDWANDRFFGDPFESHVVRMLRQVYANREQEDWDADDLIYSGLVPYNSSFSAFKELVSEYVNNTAGVSYYFCFYCKGLVKYQGSVHPIVAHFNDSNPGCYFFEYVKRKLGLTEALTEEALLEFCKKVTIIDNLEGDGGSGSHQEPAEELGTEQEDDKELDISSSPPLAIPSPAEDTEGKPQDGDNNSSSGSDARQHNSSIIPFKRKFTGNTSSPQSRKRIKLTRSSPQRISLNSSIDEASNLSIKKKAIIIDLEQHVERKRDTTIKPNLLLDSDESTSGKGGAFSFSNQGDSHFELDVSPTKSIRGAEVVDNNSKVSQKLNVGERTNLAHNSSLSPPQTSPEFFTALSRQTTVFQPESPRNVSPSNDLEVLQSSTPAVHKINWNVRPETDELFNTKPPPVPEEKQSSSFKLDNLPMVPQLIPSSSSVEANQTSSSDTSSLSSSSSSPIASPRYDRKPTAPFRASSERYRRLRHL